jgi:hypothetical protein
LNFCRKQLASMLVELTDRVGIGAEEREVPIDGLDRPELGIGNEPPLGLAISRREDARADRAAAPDQYGQPPESVEETKPIRKRSRSADGYRRRCPTFAVKSLDERFRWIASPQGQPIGMDWRLGLSDDRYKIRRVAEQGCRRGSKTGGSSDGRLQLHCLLDHLQQAGSVIFHI